MRELSQIEIVGVCGGAEPAAKVSCCSWNFFGLEIEVNFFSLSVPEGGTTISQQYTQMNNGVPRG